MANTLLTIQMVTFEALRVLENQLGASSRINRQYDDKFAIAGAKIGDTLNIRKPPRYKGRLGDGLQIEDTQETSVPLKLDTLFGVDVEFSSVERTLSLDDYSRRILKPKMATIANKIDYDVLQKYKEIYNSVGSPGTVPSAFSTYLDAGVKLNHEAAPIDDERYVCVNPQMEATIVNAALAWFNPQRTLSEQYRKGRMGEFGGFEWFMDQNTPTHVFGTYSGTAPVIATTAVDGATTLTITVDSGTSSWKKGDVFTVADCYAVNPQSRMSTGQLRQFVVTSDVADSSGTLTVPISPTVRGPGSQFQNVDSLPTALKTVTLISTTGRTFPVGLAFHRDWATLATADLELPRGVHEAARIADASSGLSVRMVTAFDIRSNKMITRLDVLYGIAVLYPELACRISS